MKHPVLPKLYLRLSPNFSRRVLPVGLVVVHRPVGSYHGSIESMCDRRHEASAHVIVNEYGNEATQLVPWGRKAWACRFYNSRSDNIETPDHIWLDPLDEERLRIMRVCARVVAFRLHKRKAPARWVRSGFMFRKGVTRHYDLGKAGGGHTDPTTDPHRWEIFLSMVDEELRRGGFRKDWGL